MDLVASSIADYTLTNGIGFDQNSTTLASWETAEFSEIKVQTDGSEDIVDNWLRG